MSAGRAADSSIGDLPAGCIRGRGNVHYIQCRNECSLNICFCHGLQEDVASNNTAWFSTFLHSGFFWPSALAKELPDAHILSLTYDFRSTRSSKVVGPARVKDTAAHIFSALLSELTLDKPTVFFAHSSGGLIIMEICNQALQRVSDKSASLRHKAKAFLQNIRLIHFASSPLGGANLTVPLLYLNNQSPTLQTLMIESTLREDILRRFNHFRQSLYGGQLRVCGTGEDCATRLFAQVAMKVVPTSCASSIFPAGDFRIVQGTDHYTIARWGCMRWDLQEFASHCRAIRDTFVCEEASMSWPFGEQMSSHMGSLLDSTDGSEIIPAPPPSTSAESAAESRSAGTELRGWLHCLSFGVQQLQRLSDIEKQNLVVVLYCFNTFVLLVSSCLATAWGALGATSFTAIYIGISLLLTLNLFFEVGQVDIRRPLPLRVLCKLVAAHLPVYKALWKADLAIFVLSLLLPPAMFSCEAIGLPGYYMQPVGSLPSQPPPGISAAKFWVSRIFFEWVYNALLMLAAWPSPTIWRTFLAIVILGRMALFSRAWLAYSVGLPPSVQHFLAGVGLVSLDYLLI